MVDKILPPVLGEVMNNFDLSRYHEVLQERDALRERVKQLQDENERLRQAIEKLITTLNDIANRAEG